MCTGQLASLTQDYEQLAELWAEILAVSNEDVERGHRLLQKIGPAFKLLVDSDGHVIRTYGVLAPRRDIVGVLRRKHDYALPATFVIDRNGIVRWRYVGASYRDRPANTVILEVLRQVVDGQEPDSNSLDAVSI